MTASFVSTSRNGGNVAGGTGVVVTKPTGLANSDVLLACASVVRTTLSGFASSGWTAVPSSFAWFTTGNDRAAEMLYKVVTSAGSEPASYTFTRTVDAATWCQNVHIVALRGIDNTTPFDATTAFADVQNDITPAQPAITTTTSGAMLVAFHMQTNAGAAEDGISDIVAVAPSGFTLAGTAQTSTDGSTNQDLFSAVAYKVAGAAGVQTPGSWLHSAGGLATNDNIAITAALRAAGAPPPPTVDSGQAFQGGGWW
jgi:hypothetical protein